MSRGEQFVPARAPDHLDDVPTVAPELRLEFLDDLAVAAHRPVEALEVAVHDEDQIVEAFPVGEAESSPRLGLVELPVARKAPDPRAARVEDPPVHQVAVEARLVDRADRPEAHRDGRELPEIGHETRVRVTRQAVPAGFEPEVLEIGLAQAAFDEGARVDPGGGVALEEHLVAGAVVLAVEEVVEADLVERARRGVGGEVAADPGVAGVGTRHHGGRVPADVGADPSLEVLVPGEDGLLVGRDRVDVRRRDGRREVDLKGDRATEQLHEDEAGPGLATLADDSVERVDPLVGLGRIDVGHLV